MNEQSKKRNKHFLDKENWPRTHEAAVSLMIEKLSHDWKETIAATDYSKLVNLNRLLGMGIRNYLGLWRGNEELMKSCLQLRKMVQLDPDVVSLIIIEEIWKRLNEK